MTAGATSSRHSPTESRVLPLLLRGVVQVLSGSRGFPYGLRWPKQIVVDRRPDDQSCGEPYHPYQPHEKRGEIIGEVQDRGGEPSRTDEIPQALTTCLTLRLCDKVVACALWASTPCNALRSSSMAR